MALLPATQTAPEQQKPPPHTPLPGAPQEDVQAPAAHVGVPLEHVTQAPERPHIAFCVPGWQVPFIAALQHPPLHGCAMPQTAVHECDAVSHAKPRGQSAVRLQPHAPLTQACPACDAEQSKQALPVLPQAFTCVPAAQVIPLQQPVLQPVCAMSPHADSHWCMTVLHERPGPQSAAELQPQRCRLFDRMQT